MGTKEITADEIGDAFEAVVAALESHQDAAVRRKSQKAMQTVVNAFMGAKSEAALAEQFREASQREADHWLAEFQRATAAKAPSPSAPSPSAPSLFLAELDTAHYVFRACADSSEEAVAVLKKGWEAHKAKTGDTTTWTDWRSCVAVYRLDLGACFRNYQQLHP